MNILFVVIVISVFHSNLFEQYIPNRILFVYPVELRDEDKVGLEDFEMLKVLGTGGK